MSGLRVEVTIERRELGLDPKRPDRNVCMLFNKCTFHASGWAEFGTNKNNFTDADVRNSPPPALNSTNAGGSDHCERQALPLEPIG